MAIALYTGPLTAFFLHSHSVPVFGFSSDIYFGSETDMAVMVEVIIMDNVSVAFSVSVPFLIEVEFQCREETNTSACSDGK